MSHHSQQLQLPSQAPLLRICLWMRAPGKFKVGQFAVEFESHDDAQVTSGPLGFANLPPNHLFVAGSPLQSLAMHTLFDEPVSHVVKSYHC